MFCRVTLATNSDYFARCNSLIGHYKGDCILWDHHLKFVFRSLSEIKKSNHNLIIIIQTSNPIPTKRDINFWAKLTDERFLNCKLSVPLRSGSFCCNLGTKVPHKGVLSNIEMCDSTKMKRQFNSIKVRELLPMIGFQWKKKERAVISFQNNRVNYRYIFPARNIAT